MLSNEQQIVSSWELLKKKNPKLRIRDAASELNVSEAELVALGLGTKAIRLNNDWHAMLPDLESLGSVMALTRNEHVVHERHGVYKEGKLLQHGNMGLLVNPDIDLRIFFSHWHFGFQVTEEVTSGKRQSLQFFDKDGMAVHKIYITEQSNQQAFVRFVEKYQSDEQLGNLDIAEVVQKRFNQPDSAIDIEGFREAWDGLKDTHDFFPLLHEFKVDRLQALMIAGSSRAREVVHSSLRIMLEKAVDMRLEIMVFVSSRGVIQIHTGRIEKIAAIGEWFNVLDQHFNLHIKESQIGSCWAVAKPTVDGQVTSLEVYDKEGNMMVQFFGKRKPGQTENAFWRAIVEHLTSV